MRGLGNQIAVVLMAGAALLAAPVMRSIVPEQFVLDGGHIDHSIHGPILGDAQSFRRVAAIYTALGLGDQQSLAAMLGIALFIAAVFAAIGWTRIRDLSLVGLAAVAASLGLAAVYLAQYSKEHVTLLLVLLVLLLPRGRRWDLAVPLLCVAYGATLRPYWLLIAVLYLGWRILLSRTRNPLVIVAALALVYALLQPAFQIALGQTLEGMRTWSNEQQANADVATVIDSAFPDATGPLGVLSALIALVFLVIPVPLGSTGTPYYAVSALLIMAIWAVALRPVVSGELITTGRASRAGGARWGADPARLGAAPIGSPAASQDSGVRTARAVSLLLALLVVQAIFEPDYGSYLKHLTPMLPLALAALPSGTDRSHAAAVLFPDARAARRQERSARHRPPVRAHRPHPSAPPVTSQIGGTP
ncbi:hypothetical protein [Brachybacterium sp. ACRRE]|uniref:hypothetical protein n=1 Tax=Brachybacterium sp. ACRRE TaxID=2918184 RepID=UPI001EF18E81|nr:hypothetical protein [Brachybacterium sp. ACRRE]MCG7309856.1 hypothetical protein [Brachybacterium sp. ACRRE]